MTANIRRSLAAESDLSEIWLYVAEHDEDAANRLIQRLLDAILRLVDFPRIGHSRDDIMPGVRLLLQDEYLIIYRYDETQNAVDVERIVHGRRDLIALLGPAD